MTVVRLVSTSKYTILLGRYLKIGFFIGVLAEDFNKTTLRAVSIKDD